LPHALSHTCSWASRQPCAAVPSMLHHTHSDRNQVHCLWCSCALGRAPCTRLPGRCRAQPALRAAAARKPARPRDGGARAARPAGGPDGPARAARGLCGRPGTGGARALPAGGQRRRHALCHGPAHEQGPPHPAHARAWESPAAVPCAQAVETMTWQPPASGLRHACMSALANRASHH